MHMRVNLPPLWLASWTWTGLLAAAVQLAVAAKWTGYHSCGCHASGWLLGHWLIRQSSMQVLMYWAGAAAIGRGRGETVHVRPPKQLHMHSAAGHNIWEP
jgi:hypothetical protein